MDQVPAARVPLLLPCLDSGARWVAVGAPNAHPVLSGWFLGGPLLLLAEFRKYCPNTNEVFLSILVYFDRMSKLAAATDRKFVIDSYNVHRLVIAGVTTASKFLSDICYPNSRWAKVGGLSQAELNELELQFVLLNDFRLVSGFGPTSYTLDAPMLRVIVGSTESPSTDFAIVVVSPKIPRCVDCCVQLILIADRGYIARIRHVDTDDWESTSPSGSHAALLNSLSLYARI
ncbi:cyclin-domain-containing protein [Mycena olivaceomarginata]|nr:cyclin-domain-containing protein [Mycena olivaceomarginata]